MTAEIVDVVDLSYDALFTKARNVGTWIRHAVIGAANDVPTINIYGVPNGGIYAAMLVNIKHPHYRLVDDPYMADAIVDDIIDSGRTRESYKNCTSAPFFALVDKLGVDADLKGKWVRFPWERAKDENATGAEDAVVRLLECMGEDPKRDGLKDTPKRVVKSFREFTAGYNQSVEEIFTVFDGVGYDEMVICRNIEFCSLCEHHMLPFIGHAHVAYIPNHSKKIVGLSKLARLVDIYARRLQVQERLTQQITDALEKYLEPLGAACIIEAQHLCMACRGVRKQNSDMVTQRLTGVFREEPETRAELLSAIWSGKGRSG